MGIIPFHVIMRTQEAAEHESIVMPKTYHKIGVR